MPTVWLVEVFNIYGRVGFDNERKFNNNIAYTIFPKTELYPQKEHWPELVIGGETKPSG